MNARANWELIVVQLVQLLAVTALVLVGLVPLFLGLGVASIEPIPDDPESIARWLEGLLGAAELGPALLGGTALLAIWLVAMLVYCYFQAGLFGVVVSAEHQAPVGSVSEPRLFRTFKLGNLLGWSRRYTWRLFWFFNVLGGVVLAATVLVVLFFAAVVYIGSRYGTGSGVAIGCIGALPVLFALIALSLWAILAQVELVRPESGFWSAQRRALDVLGRRLGAATVIWVIWVVLSLVVGVGFAVASLTAELGLAGSGVAKAIATVVLTGLQWGAGAALTLAMSASFAALARSVVQPAATGVAATAVGPL